MDEIKDTSYRKAKRCLSCSWACNIILVVLAVLYCIGLIFMEVSVGKIGKLAPDEKNMIDEKVTTVMDVADSYAVVLD